MSMGLMNLDKLIKTQEQTSTREFPISAKELCNRYEQLYSGAINDVLREFVLMDQALPSSIMPLREEMKITGIAFTIKSSVDPRISGEMETRSKMLNLIHEDAVCIWDTSGDTTASQWGEVMTAAAKKRGARGAVVDGGLRDTRQVLEQKFPVFYKYRTSNGSLGRCLITAYQVPIRIGRTIIRPGDVVFGDIDGVLVVPRDVAYEVLLRAEEIKTNEKEIRRWVDEGMSAEEVVKKGGYF
jgi:4-hydroxy-4-methyl-2-oxoglutarate aldolase